MTTYKPYRSDDWNSDEAYDLEDNSSDYNEVDHSVMEALSVHLGSGSLFSKVTPSRQNFRQLSLAD